MVAFITDATGDNVGVSTAITHFRGANKWVNIKIITTYDSGQLTAALQQRCF